jgi:hypothetical protein
LSTRTSAACQAGPGAAEAFDRLDDLRDDRRPLLARLAMRAMLHVPLHATVARRRVHQDVRFLTLRAAAAGEVRGVARGVVHLAIDPLHPTVGAPQELEAGRANRALGVVARREQVLWRVRLLMRRGRGLSAAFALGSSRGHDLSDRHGLSACDRLRNRHGLCRLTVCLGPHFGVPTSHPKATSHITTDGVSTIGTSKKATQDCAGEDEKDGEDNHDGPKGRAIAVVTCCGLLISGALECVALCITT